MHDIHYTVYTPVICCCSSFRVPDAVVLKKHVLVMSFIGEDGRPAPKLKDAVEHMTKDMVNKAYAQLEETMVRPPISDIIITGLTNI